MSPLPNVMVTGKGLSRAEKRVSPLHLGEQEKATRDVKTEFCMEGDGEETEDNTVMHPKQAPGPGPRLLSACVT